MGNRWRASLRRAAVAGIGIKAKRRTDWIPREPQLAAIPHPLGGGHGPTANAPTPWRGEWEQCLQGERFAGSVKRFSDRLPPCTSPTF